MGLLEEKQIKCIIFDFDGVIAETDSGRFNVLSEIMIHHDINIKNSFDVSSIIGISTKRFLEVNFPNLQEDEIYKIIKKRQSEYLANLKKYCIPLEGSVETLFDLQSINIDLVLATTNEEDILEHLLSYLDIKKVFSCTFPRERTEITNSPFKNYKFVLRKIGRTENECIIIEDSPIGIKSAKRAGIQCIQFGASDTNNIADYKVRNYQELRRLLGI